MRNILLTNDDGINAPGLRALAEAMQGLATVTVVAPLHERSAAAQSLTLRQPIYIDHVSEREYAVDGTPADAMILAFHALLGEKPDLVISGINRGGNMGENIYYSGTVGAAMEAAINRVPAIAVSVSSRDKEFDFAPAARFTRSLAPLQASAADEGIALRWRIDPHLPLRLRGRARQPHRRHLLLPRRERPRCRCAP